MEKITLKKKTVNGEDTYSRELNIPESYRKAGVEHDCNVRGFVFSLPRFPEGEGGVDLSLMDCHVNYRNDRLVFRENVITTSHSSKYVEFLWVMGANCFRRKGSLEFVFCATKYLNEEGSSELQQEWNTEIATVEVMQGLEPEIEEISSVY